jgi:ABC-type uncharacterized transport system permease subunit
MPTGIQAAMKWLPFYYELFCPVAIVLERLRGNLSFAWMQIK